METKPTPEELAEAYRNANASLRARDAPGDLTPQQRVFDGEWTRTSSFASRFVASASERDAARRAS